MTVVGSGGVVITSFQMTARFQRDYRKLSADLQEKTDKKLMDLLKNPRPPGLAFEKLKGYCQPDIYTIHITGNVKLSFTITGQTATLRRVAIHDDIDRSP